MNKKIIKELNTFLKGNFMAIHAYEKYINHIQDEQLKEIFQEIQQNHKEHAAIISERIQNLDGVPVDDVGIMGNVAQIMTTIKGSTKDNTSIIKDALVGEHRGIKKSRELLDDDLDPESLKIVQTILDNDERHVERLDQLLH